MARDMKVDPSIARQAAEWWARLHDEDSSPQDQREFGSWVTRSPERIEAYLEMARLTSALGSESIRWPDTPAAELIRAARASASGAVILRPDSLLRQAVPAGSSGLPVVPAVAREAGSRWHGKSLWSIAAGIVLAVALTSFWLAMPQRYVTRFGEQRSILLADGSRVTLNTASRIEVAFQKHHRVVRLVAGEALFEVARDPSRPFDVLAHDSVVRALGTEFNVDLQATEATVTVVEGRVAVAKASDLAAMTGRAIGRYLAQQPAPPGSLILAAAERVVIRDAGIGAPQHLVNAAAATAWVEHRLIFDHESLGRVAEQFNRYNHEQIVIEGADLARKEVTGVFQSDDPGSFLSFLSGIRGVTVRKAADGTYLVSTAARGSGQPPGN